MPGPLPDHPTDLLLQSPHLGQGQGAGTGEVSAEEWGGGAGALSHAVSGVLLHTADYIGLINVTLNGTQPNYPPTHQGDEQSLEEIGGRLSSYVHPM